MTPAGSPRGPTGTATFPPHDLVRRTLPIEIVPAGAPLYRIHRTVHGPIFYGPGVGMPPTYRYDSLTGAFGVLYVSLQPTGALVETLVRNPEFEIVAHEDVAACSISELRSDRDLSLAKLYGSGLSQLGLRNDISTGPYEPCGAWADALWAHPARLDGLLYHSRHDPLQICVALFERTNQGVAIQSSTALIEQMPWVRSQLARYGKRILKPRTP